MSLNISRFNCTMLKIMSNCKNSYIFIEDTNSGHCRWSCNAREAFALESEYFKNFQMWSTIIHPNDFEDFYITYKNMVTGEQAQMSNDYRLKMKDGTYAWMHCNGWYVTSDYGEPPVFAGMINKVDLERTIDSVTNLKGNYDFRMTLEDMVQHRDPRSILILGIDEFKEINDLYSYSFGDKVLAAFAQKMLEAIPKNVSVYRLDGDGFGLLFPTGEVEEVLLHYRVMQQLAQSSIRVNENVVSLTVSGGVSRYPIDGEDSELLYRNARMALRAAKSKGKNQLIIFSDKILTEEHFKMQLLGCLRDSVKLGFQGFSLCYQPLMDAEDGGLYGCEALLRWKHPNFPQGVSPCEFIPILEESGLILEVGNWVLTSALKQCAVWGKLRPGFQMNINVSSAQFENPNFKFFLMDMLAEYRILPSMITLELTESGQILDPAEMQHIFDFIRGQGIKIAFDDFGLGYASLSIFRVLSADELKIDRSFLERISYDVTDQKIITQIINLCHSMNMSVCVEGIETIEMEAIVKQLGPDLLQGFYYNRPMSALAFENAYFGEHPVINDSAANVLAPEHSQSMVYAPFCPAQPMSREDVIDNAYAGIFQVGMDHEFTFLTCNEGYRRMLGYTAKEMDEKFKNRALGFVHPEDAEYVNEEIRHQLSRGDTVTIEFRVVKSNGTPIWILGTGNVVKNRHGGASLIVVIIDNDRIKKENLRKEQGCQFYKKILDNVVTGIKCVRFDSEFTLDYISSSFLSILGYTLEDIQTLFDGKYINMIYEEDRKSVINGVVEQLKISNVVTMRYRSPCKDGRLIWLDVVSQLCPPDDDGIQRAYSSVVGVTDAAGEHQANHCLNIANRYQAAVQQWGDILFEYDFQSGELAYSDNFNTIFGRQCQTSVENELEFVYEADRKLVFEALEVVHSGKQPQPVDVRIMKKNGEFHWYCVMFTLPERLGDIPVSAIGKISDIDAQKRECDSLLIQSQRDSMTGLLNKGTAEKEVRKILSAAQVGEQYALLILDIDNFKKINDSLGHSSGDQVICEIASRIQKSFKENEIVGRAGGDEFLVFIPYEGNNSEIITAAEKLIARLRKDIIIEQREYQISVSIGIARYPYDGTQFYDLFRRADSALYRAKELGKDTYCFAAK